MTITKEDALEHHGVIGMHWGHHKSKAELLDAAKAHEELSAMHVAARNEAIERHLDLEKNGVNSEPFKTVYGKYAKDMTEREFYGKNGQTKAMALQQTDNNLRMMSNFHTRRANRHSAKAKKLREKAANMQHGDLVFDEESVDEFLAHHGVMGMKWGHHKGGGASAAHPSQSENVWRAGKSYKPSHDEIVTARHNQIARRKEYQEARKSGEKARIAKARDAFNYNQDRVTADHLTKGEKAVTLLLQGGGGVAAARTSRSTHLSKAGGVARVGLAGDSVGTLAGARIERGAIQKSINRHNARK